MTRNQTFGVALRQKSKYHSSFRLIKSEVKSFTSTVTGRNQVAFKKKTKIVCLNFLNIKCRTTTACIKAQKLDVT